MEYAQVAYVMGITIDNVKRIEHRALKKLKKTIETNDEFKDLKAYVDYVKEKPTIN